MHGTACVWPTGSACTSGGTRRAGTATKTRTWAAKAGASARCWSARALEDWPARRLTRSRCGRRVGRSRTRLRHNDAANWRCWNYRHGGFHHRRWRWGCCDCGRRRRCGGLHGGAGRRCWWTCYHHALWRRCAACNGRAFAGGLAGPLWWPGNDGGSLARLRNNAAGSVGRGVRRARLRNAQSRHHGRGMWISRGQWRRCGWRNRTRSGTFGGGRSQS